MVPGGGVEPPRPFGQQILSLPRLPISSPRQGCVRRGSNPHAEAGDFKSPVSTEFHHARKSVFTPIRSGAIACRMVGRVSCRAYLRVPVFCM